jgi:peptide/nickel transport system substrate-binding protein
VLKMNRMAGFVLSLALLMTACAPSQSGGGAQSQDTAARPALYKKVVAGLRGEPFTLSNQLGRAGAGRVYGVAEVERMLHSGLSIEDDQAEHRPSLAEAVPSVDNGLWRVFPDGRMETTWKILPNAQWHDGTLLTSADFLFTMQVVQDKELPEFGDIAFESIDTVEAPDGRTVLVRWKKPFIWAHTLFSGTRGVPQPKHLLERTYLDSKVTYKDISYWMEDFVGTGPFRLKELVRGSHMILLANDQYALGRPRIDEVEVKFFQDSNALAASLLSGFVDLTMSGQGTLSLDQALQLRDQWKEGKIEPVLSGAVGTFPQFIDPSPRVILDVPFRRALVHAVDRQLLIDTLQGGLSPIAHTNFTPQQPEYKDIQGQIVRYEYDPRRAAQLIEGLGYTRGPDSMFRDGAGQPLSVELRSTPGRDVNEKTTLVVADHWRAVGVGVDVVVIPAQRNQDREYRQTRPGFEVVGQPDDIYRFHSNQIPTAETRYVGDNRMRYGSPQLDSLVDRYYVTIPRAERVQVLGQIMNHITDQVVLLSFFYEAGPLLISNRVKNVTSVPTWNAYQWDVS